VSVSELAQVGAVLGGAGFATLALGRPRALRLAGFGAWAVGVALFLPLLAPSGHALRLGGLAVVGILVAGAFAVVFRRWPWALAFLALGAAPVRIPVHVGDTSANLLVPLYAVIAGAALALAWGLWRDEPRSRELGPASLPVAALSAWFALSLVWSGDVRQGSITLFFFIFPFGLLAFALARLPWSGRFVTCLYAELAALALVFAAVGIGQWVTRDIFWNPKVIVGNAYAPFYRVNSVFWDPSIYGRFLVVAILATLSLLLFRAIRDPFTEIVAAAVIVVLWIGLVFSFSQSSFVSLAVGVVLAASLAWRWRAAAAVAIVAAVMIPLGVASPQLHTVRHDLVASSASGINRATSGRFRLVENGLRIAEHHPIVGVGIGGFQRAYAERLHLRRGSPKAASHNTPVTVFAETGVIGFGLFVWMLVAAFLLAFRGNGAVGRAPERAAAIAGIAFVAIVVHSQFYNAFFEDPLIWGLLALTAIAVRARQEEAMA
jgi:putative inorganic carbon (HCO3(-)) transporter